MVNEVVKLKRETIEACITCPLCNKLFRDATTIIECLHTFCRKCIYKKLIDEELRCCPVCNCYLGCIQQEKLRPDRNLQDVRAKIFPCKRRNLEAPEFIVDAPCVSALPTMTGEKTKSVARKAATLRRFSFYTEKPIKKKKESEDGNEGSDSVPSYDSNFNNSHGDHWERAEVSGVSGISLQAVVDSSSGRCERSGPIWFSLVASKDRDSNSSLPQIPARYLRIKDGCAPVAFIQKYLLRKLDLASEDEVEIKFMGKPVAATLQIKNLLDLQSQSLPSSQKMPVLIGSSAKDFVMELTYSLRVKDA